MLSVSSVPLVIQKAASTIASLASINQELLIFGHINGSEAAMYRLSQRLRMNVITLEMVIEDLQPKNEAKIIRDDFGIFEHLLPVELVEYKKIEDEKHKVFCTWRFLENRKFEILKSVKNRLTGRAE